MAVRYKLFEEKLHTDDIGDYVSYGINAVCDNEGIASAVHDISPNKERVSILCRLCNDGDLSQTHLIDVVEDFL